MAEPRVDLAQALALARARIAELEAAGEEQRRATRTRDALFRIADTASRVEDLPSFYAAIHGIVADLMYGQNFYIALYDDERQMINWPYYRDTVDDEIPDPSVWEPFGTGNASGLTALVLRTGRTQHVTLDRSRELEEQGDVALVGVEGQDWLGTPLQAEGKILGAIVVQTYRPGEDYTDEDVAVLTFVAQNIAISLRRVQSAAEVRQRTAEQEIVARISQAMSAQVGLAALIDLVGDEMRAVFDADIVYVALHDRESDLIDFPYFSESGVRATQDKLRFGEGLTSRILAAKRPLLLNQASQFDEIGTRGLGTQARSYLGVPIMVGEEAIGVICVQSSTDEGRFGVGDESLLSTIAASVGAAIEHVRLLEARQESEQRYRRLVEELPLAVYIDAPNGAFSYLSPQIEAMTGHPVEAWLGPGFFAGTVHPDDKDRVMAAIDAAIEGGDEGWSLDYRLTTASGSIAWIRDASVIVRDATGAAEFIQGYLLDVTEQVRARAELSALDEQYRRLVEELPLVVYQDRPDTTATSVYISPRVEQMFGYPRDAWMRDDFFASVLHPDDRERVTVYTEGVLEGTEQVGTDEYRVIAADGRVVWVRDDQWIVRDAEGQPQYVQGVMIDVTDQTVAQAEIRRQKQYFEALVEISPVAVVTMDREEIVSGWNPAATRLFGYQPEAAIGRHIDDLLFRPEGREEGRETTRIATETGRAHLIGQRRRQDGELVDVEIVLVPLVVDDDHTGYYAIYHDITELQEARREADLANAAKSTFLAAMSHEIRTPMNAIIGMSGLLVETPLDEEQRDYAETIRTSGEALLTIINDILDFSKIEAGRIELETIPFALGPCLEGALDVVAPAAAAKAIELAYAIDADLPHAVLGDPGRLRQIVLNLLSNAVKFTEQGEVVLSVSGKRAGGRRRHGPWEITIDVRDTGIGITPDGMERLFRSFSQADASISRRYGGTGLGLAISRRLAELMAGALTATSSGIPGQGATFRLVIRANEAPAAAVEQTAPVPTTNLSGMQVLVVDDSATNRRILAALLRRWGMVPNETADPREALAWVAAGRTFDLALVDESMPDMDGPTLAARLRDVASAVGPVIIVSSSGRRRGDEAAVAATLTKPVKPSPLLDMIQTVLAGTGGDAASASTGAAAMPVTTVLGATHPLRILLAEDNAVNQKLAIRLLAQMGYEADLANNGLEAVEAVERATYDVILMDVQMPELDGLEATRRIRARSSPHDRPRIVAMTANAMAGDREACLAAGMDDYLSKPIRVGQLAAALAASPRTDGGAVA